MKPFVMIHLLYVICFVILIVSPSVFAQYPNIRVNNPASTTPEEVTIAVNPANPMNLIAGANIRYMYYSTNGGWNWTEGQLSSPYGVWGDPSVTFDANGNAYYGHLSNPPSPGYWIDRIVVQKSTNGGQTWNGGFGIGYNPPRKNQDKEWLAADLTNSPYRNYVYCAWTEFDSYGSTSPADSTRILFSRTTDAGQTWSIPVKVSDVGGNCFDSDSTVEGAVPAIGPNGEIYLSWSGPWGIMFDKSTDGGASWGTDKFVTDQPGGWDFDIPGIYRANGMPITACDLSNSPYRGNIYIQWSDQRNGTNNTDIFFVKSADSGQTWGATVKVNDDTGTHQQFFSWMTVDQSTGNIYIVFYDRRNTSGSATDIYIAKSTDGGDTWKNIKVSQSSFTPVSNVFFGDYTNIAALNGMVYPIWMRMDNSNLSVWTAIVDDRPPFALSVSNGWNMVSLPLIVSDPRPQVLFPAASSPTYGYRGGYGLRDSLEFGKGYWVKFSSPETVAVRGQNVARDTIVVDEKWNMIGSISSPVAAANITSDPPGLIAAGFYQYTGADYVLADTLMPGKAYWVKMDSSGKIILSSSLTFASNRIRIIPDGDSPPPPPEEPNSLNTSRIPDKFQLRQNYPNPFNPVTVVSYQLPVNSYVTLKVFNVLGQEVATLVDQVKNSGIHALEWNTYSQPSGVYYYRLVARDLNPAKSEPYMETRKMIVIK